MARARRVTGLHPRATLLENARAIVAVRVAELFDFAHAVGDPAQDEDLHNMRIAAKRLRYTLEMFRVCLSPDGPALIDAVKEIQERIGDIHDADVLATLLRLRLAVVAQRQVEALAGAAFGQAPSDLAGVPLTGADNAPSRPDGAEEGDEERRAAAVRAVATADDPRLGLAVLMARTAARRERLFDELTSWWSDHGGDALRARLDACLIESVQSVNGDT